MRHFVIIIAVTLCILATTIQAFYQRQPNRPSYKFIRSHFARYASISTGDSVTTSNTFANDMNLSFDPAPTQNEEEAGNNKPSELSALQRFGRAFSFYSAAVPIFAAYKGVNTMINLKRTYLNENVSEEEANKMYEQIHEWGSEQIVNKIKELKGFYVKTGQIISTRVDIFPPQYTSKLAMTQDKLDPIPADIVKDIVRKELLNGAELSELFAEFEDVPLGSASIAQVHRARLLDGRIVAVKVQRPDIGPKLLGDIANLKNFAKLISDSLLIDYYKIFCELERTLIYELDFLHEAVSTNKVAAAVAHSPSNRLQRPPVRVPLPIPGLVTKHVLVMEYMDGTALSKIAADIAEQQEKNKNSNENTVDSPESRLFGGRLLQALTDAYGSMIFGSGIIHGDPHPGNIFILKEGEVALLDCGQVKEINTAQRLGLAKVIMLVHAWESINRQLGRVRPKFSTTTAAPAASTTSHNSHNNNNNSNANPTIAVEQQQALQQEQARLTKELAHLVRSFGVSFKEGAGDDCAAAVAILLFGHTDTILPGGYAGEEISLDSPIVQVQEFPAELVLLGRATVMVKGIANRLKISWGLSDRWKPLAQEALASVALGPGKYLPVWSVSQPIIASPLPILGRSGSIRSSSTNNMNNNNMNINNSMDGSNSSGDRSSNNNSLIDQNHHRLRMSDLFAAFNAWLSLCKEYATRRLLVLAQRVLPKAWQKRLLTFIAKRSGY